MFGVRVNEVKAGSGCLRGCWIFGEQSSVCTWGSGIRDAVCARRVGLAGVPHPRWSGTLRLLAVPEGVRGTGWGPGGPWLVEHFPELIGALDDPEELRTDDPVVNGLVHRARGFRICRTGRVWEALVRRSSNRRWWVPRRSAPGDICCGASVNPPPDRSPHRCGAAATAGVGADPVVGVASQRYRTGTDAHDPRATSMDVERHPDKLTVLRGGAVDGGRNPDAGRRRPGCGAGGRLPHPGESRGQTLAGSPVDDAGMLELLEPFAGQRGRWSGCASGTASGRNARAPNVGARLPLSVEPPHARANWVRYSCA